MTDVLIEREVLAQVDAPVIEARAGHSRCPDERPTASSAPGRRPMPHWLPLALAAAVIAAASPVVLWICATAHPSPVVHEVGLFVHLAALVVGFGAVLSVDWAALLFVLGRRDFREMLRAADNAAVPIWAGYAGLVLSGLVLEPNLSSPITQLKLALVLVVGLNGLVAVGLHKSLCRRGEMGWLVLGTLCATVSQIGWWGATIIGFINAH